MFALGRIVLLCSVLCAVGRSSAQAALATNCTLYAAATGKDTYSGMYPTTPKTLEGASSVSKPGSVICLLGGTYSLSRTFYPAKSGTANAWIIYKNYGDSTVNLVWTGGASASDRNMWHFYSSSLSTGKSYIEVRGLQFNGQNAASVGIKCAYSHHLRFVGNTIQNMGAAGIATIHCDYLTADGNKVYHNGYRDGWSSGISFNSNQWLDTAAGFHSLVVNNIVSGSYDASTNHSDGNGIIMDTSTGSYNYSTANTPPMLIANNVVYENGARCVNIFVVSNIWVVNNTCYKNTLDRSKSGRGEFVANNVKNSYFINNIAYAWNNGETYQKFGTTQNIVYYKNLYYGGANNFSYSDPAQFIKADPLFVNPPYVNPTNGGQYATALPSWQLGSSLQLRSGSPAIDKGINPTTLSGVPSAIVAGLRQYVLKDATGAIRPQGNGFDLGAYEY